MKKSKFSPSSIAKILQEFEQGKDLEQLLREHGISRGTFYNLRRKYGGMEAEDLKKLKRLEEENSKLKRMYADLALELDIAKFILEKKFLSLARNAKSSKRLSKFTPKASARRAEY